MTTCCHPRRFQFLGLALGGRSLEAIAHRHRVPIAEVKAAIDLARCQLAAYADSLRLTLRPPPLYLVFPVGGLFPASTCNHDRVAIPHGSLACCEVCARSGCDGHPCFDRFPEVEPKPEPKLRPAVVKPECKPTRRERRAALVAKLANLDLGGSRPAATKRKQSAA